MTYSHTQRAPMYCILIGSAALFVAMAVWIPLPLPAALMVGVVALLDLVLAFCFKTLTVRDEGTHLGVRFGPLPVFRKRIPYAEMTEVRGAKSKVVDGWGIHGVLGRGWTFNLWGFDCVEIRVRGGILRIGTDDPAGLARFLEQRIGTPA